MRSGGFAGLDDREVDLDAENLVDAESPGVQRDVLDNPEGLGVEVTGEAYRREVGLGDATARAMFGTRPNWALTTLRSGFDVAGASAIVAGVGIGDIRAFLAGAGGLHRPVPSPRRLRISAISVKIRNHPSV